MGNKMSKISELLETALKEVKALEEQATELGYERIITLTDFIDQKHDGIQAKFARANDYGTSHTGQMAGVDANGNDKFIVVGEKLYRLAREWVK